MKSLFKSKPRTPSELVRQTRDHLLFIDLHQGNKARDTKREEKLVEVSKLIREMKLVLYGVDDADPVPDACAQLTQEIFRDNTFRLLIDSVPKLNLEARRDVTHIVANLQRQKVNSRLIASDYLEANKDIVDNLVKGYEEMDLALHYGSMLKELIRHQSIAKYILESEVVKKFFDYVQLPSFDIAANASSVFKELLTRHKSTVADFLGKNYDWFFADYNGKLLLSEVYVIKLQATKLLADILLERSNSAVMTRYVNSKDNLRISMNLLKEPNKNIPMDAFHVFKLFVANQNKPPEIVSVLVHNRNKLLQLLSDFKSEKVNEQFEADKERVVQEIIALEPRD